MGAEKGAGKKVIHYEVYVLVDRRRWTLHARFPRREREQAIEEAKLADRQGFSGGVKVVREEYSPDTNTTDEVLVYVSPRTPPNTLASATAGRKMKGSEVPLPTGRDGGWGGVGGGNFDHFDNSAMGGVDDGGDEYRPAQQVSTVNFLMRVVGVIVASLVAALMIAGLASFVMNQMPTISRETYDKTLLAAFLLTFGITALPLIMTYIRGYTWHSDEDVEEFDISEIKKTPAPTKPPKKAPEVTPEPAVEPEFIPEIIDEAPQLIDDEPPSLYDEPEEKSPVDAQFDAPDFEAHRMTTMKFLGGAVAAMIDSSRPQLDAYAKFGIGLIFGGACEVMGESKGLSKKDRSLLIREAFELMGSKPELAINFADKYDAYMQEPKYLGMIQIGRDAMARYLSGSATAFTELHDALDNWVKPQAAATAAHQSIMAFMFTDIVGSTDMTQTRGDIAAQDIVRRHNAIVRTAIGSFMGKEVKHTGDGIMATFPTISGSVEACIAIQRAVDDHNKRDPSMPLHLRIGINAGEPVSEEDDFFGTTVQLSARMCAAAAADEILCSGVVKDLCAGKKLTFVDRGKLNLKGFKDPVQAYEVAWKQDGK